MKYAKKLKTSIKLLNLPRHSKIIASYGEGKDQDFPRLVLKYLPKKQKEIIEEFLPKELHNRVLGIVYSSIQLLSRIDEPKTESSESLSKKVGLVIYGLAKKIVIVLLQFKLCLI